MNLKRTFVFICLLIASNVCMGQSPLAANNTTAGSQINVRIPAFATITLSDNSTKAIPYTSSAELTRSERKLAATPSNVISNKKWSVNVSTEQTGSYTASNKLPKTADTGSVPSLTVFYVTSLN